MKPTDQLTMRHKVECYSIIYKGHIIPILKTILILQNKNPNLDISFVTGSFIKNKFQSLYPNINMIQVQDDVNEQTEKIMTKLKHTELLPFLMNHMHNYFDKKKNKPDLIIADFFMLQAFNYANRNGIKFIVNHPNSYTAMNALQNVLSLQRSIRVQGYTILHSICNHPLPDLFDHLFNAYRNRALLIYHSFIGIDDPTILPSNYALVGLLPNSVNKHEQIDNQLKDWMQSWRKNGKNKFLYISFGSIVKLSQQFNKKLVKVIQKLQYPTIWSLRSPKANQIKSKLIYHRQWLPQQLILQQEDVRGYLTHGGWGSISEAISTSTPMVCIPVFADQGQNSKLIHKKHIAITIYQLVENQCPQFLDVPLEQETIINAIRDIMEDPSYSESMKRMSRLSRTYDAAQNISKIVQRLLEFGYEYLMNPLCENATIKDNSVLLKDILVEKYWHLLEKKN